jgi:hypothetical protein
MSDEPEILGKQALLDAIRAEYHRLAAVISPLDPAMLAEPGVFDDWSVKDVIAHITSWEQRLCLWIETWRRGETVQRPEPGLDWSDTDRINQRDFDAKRDLSLGQVLDEARASYPRTLALVEGVDERGLTEKSADWNDLALSWIVRANTDEHYAEHRQQIEAWLRAKQP